MKIEEVINTGGLSIKNATLMQIYADIIGKPMKVSQSEQTCALGAASLALLASGFAGGVLVNSQRRPTVPASFRRLTFRRGMIRSARLAPDGELRLVARADRYVDLRREFGRLLEDLVARRRTT